MAKRRKHQGEGFNNSTRVGDFGEVLVMLDLMRKGYEVFRAICRAAIVDLVVLKDGKLFRVEVTKGFRDGVKPKLRWPKHDRTRYDVLAIWESDGSITYFKNDEPIET